MPMTINKETNAALQFANALQANDAEQVSEAMHAVMNEIANKVRGDFEAYQITRDENALAQRGYRQLTTAENKFYDALAAASRAADAPSARNAFIEVIGDGKDEDLMPVTIIQDVFKDLEEEHELLQVIDFTYVRYATKWIRNKHEAQKAVWGKITDAITKEITSDLTTMKLDQHKLTAFLVIPLDIIDMGHTFMDAYARACLKEALLDGLEDGIINGNGLNAPVGLIRNVAADVSVSQETGYPEKDAITVTSFDKKTYFDLVARLATTERGKNRKFNQVALLVNTADYLTKVAPATTLLTQGGYVKDIFPFPTKPIKTNCLASGKAVMFIPKAYTFCVGGSRNGAIEFSDEFKFLDDARTYKIVQHGDGIADDNTAAIVLDISNLEELLLTVKTVEAVATV